MTALSSRDVCTYIETVVKRKSHSGSEQLSFVFHLSALFQREVARGDFLFFVANEEKKGYAKYDDVRTAISLIDRRKENATLCYIDTREREPWQPKWRCAHDGARSFHFILSVYP